MGDPCDRPKKEEEEEDPLDKVFLLHKWAIFLY